jgi:hypothetical protein
VAFLPTKASSMKHLTLCQERRYSLVDLAGREWM